MKNDFPRLLIISDEPIAAGVGSAEALRRLLERYPSEKLFITQTEGVLPKLEIRIRGADYARKTVIFDRALRTRFSTPANVLKALGYLSGISSLTKHARMISPDAVITLVRGNGWVAARRVALSLGVPLHLIVHDGPSHFQLDFPVIGPLLRREFTAACRQAASRWSISYALDQEVQRITGAPGDVLPPFRHVDDFPIDFPETEAPNTDAVYFGSLTSRSICQMMNDCATELEALGGRLHVYGGVSQNVSKSGVWAERRFIHHGFFDDRSKFLRDCGKQYRFMYLPFSFEDSSMEFSFPSKLIDYTLVGLPILVQAPPNSPLGIWCSRRPDASIFVGEPGIKPLRPKLMALTSSAEMRHSFAKGAFEAGELDFSFDSNSSRFLTGLMGDGVGFAGAQKCMTSGHPCRTAHPQPPARQVKE